MGPIKKGVDNLPNADPQHLLYLIRISLVAYVVMRPRKHYTTAHVATGSIKEKTIMSIPWPLNFALNSASSSDRDVSVTDDAISSNEF